ncbi:hypothetical protein KAU33_08930 [Candidatus Dependentiae bacterium]|nr:hypothetical protein [Candidatus Dependentiae bacterium]
MFNHEIELLKGMTEEELHKYFGNYITGSIVLFAIITLCIGLSTITLSFTTRLFILTTAFVIATMIWTFNLLLARLHCKKRLISG